LAGDGCFRWFATANIRSKYLSQKENYQIRCGASAFKYFCRITNNRIAGREYLLWLFCAGAKRRPNDFPDAQRTFARRKRFALGREPLQYGTLPECDPERRLPLLRKDRAQIKKNVEG
jgi:hypothetical protein